MTERVGTLKSSVEGPRWAAFPKFLRDACFAYDLKILHMEVDKGWVRETVRFKVEGSESNLNRLKIAIERGIEEYNT